MTRKAGLCFLFLLLCLVSTSLATRRTKTDQEIYRAITNGKIKNPNDKTSRRINTYLDDLKDFVKKSNASEKASMGNSIVTSVKAIGKLQSDDPGDIVRGCMELLSGITDFTKSLAKMSPLLLLISEAIGLFDSSKTEESINNIVQRALEAQSDKELLECAYATKTEFETSKAFLDGLKASPLKLSESHIAVVQSNIPIYKGVRMITLLSRRVEAAEPTNRHNAERIMNLLEALIDLTIIREIILADLYCQISIVENSLRIASGIINVRKSREESLKKKLQALLTGDNPKYWVFLSHLYPERRNAQTEKIFWFFKTLGISGLPRINNVISGKKTFSSLRWPAYCMTEQDSSEYLLGNKLTSNNDGHCTMKLQILKDGFYKIRVLNNRIAYASKEYFRVDQNPGKNSSKINLIPVKKNEKEFYIISSFMWPDRFAYMAHGNNGFIKFYQGNPDKESGTQAFWTIHNA